MSFPFGKPILVMLAVSLLSGAFIALRPSQRRADLTIWVFADSHFRAYQPLVKKFQEETGLTVNLSLVSNRALNLRLASLFMTRPDSSELPDLAEIEIGAVGQYFRPPVSEIGFIPLNNLLMSGGYLDRLPKMRLATWSKQGVIFGAPHDIHPTTISFRKDLFDQAGVDLESAKTWPEFQEKCLAFQSYWKNKGYPYRHAVELAESTADHLPLLLLQQHINLVDDFGRIHMTEPKVAKTVAFYAQMVAGSRAIGATSSGGQAGFTKDLNEGNLCAFFTPDWRVTYLRQYASSDLRGKMRMMPLPVFDQGDTPTVTWGGTMIGITRGSRSRGNEQKAWQLLQYLYFSRPGIEERRKQTDILPPIKDYWRDPYYAHDDYWYESAAATQPAVPGMEKTNKTALFGMQHSNEVFVKLADQIPPRYVTPATAMANASLAAVLNRAVDQVKGHGIDGLEQACQNWLADAAADLQKRMDHWKFPE